MQPVITDLAELFHYIFRLHDETKRGMSAALSSCPKCHFAMLETLSTLIAKHGHEGTIYVSQLAEASRQTMPVISRGLRTLEQEGLIERITDPNDRRKTLVRITPQGRAASAAGEEALVRYFSGIAHRLTPEQRQQFSQLKDILLAAIEAENAEQNQKSKGDNQNG